MKKLITFILILALILPAGALADSNDLIVGYWYMFIDGDRYPELMQNFGDYDSALSLYYFAKDGTVYILENDIKDGAASPVFMSCGRWEKDKKRLRYYSFQIFGLGDGEIRIEDNGNMYMTASAAQVATHLRMIVPFSPYVDYIMEGAGK